MMSSGAPPREAAKHDGDRSTPFRQRPAISGRKLRRRRLETPLRLLASLWDGHLRRIADERMRMAVLAVASVKAGAEVRADFREDAAQVLHGRFRQHVPAAFRDEDRMDVEREEVVPSGAAFA